MEKRMYQNNLLWFFYYRDIFVIEDIYALCLYENMERIYSPYLESSSSSSPEEPGKTYVDDTKTPLPQSNPKETSQQQPQQNKSKQTKDAHKHNNGPHEASTSPAVAKDDQKGNSSNKKTGRIQPSTSKDHSASIPKAATEDLK